MHGTDPPEGVDREVAEDHRKVVAAERVPDDGAAEIAGVQEVKERVVLLRPALITMSPNFE